MKFPYSGDVPDRAGRLLAASGGLARLLVILGLLVGLTALQGTHCRENFQLSHSKMCPVTVSPGIGADGEADLEFAYLVKSQGMVLYDALSTVTHYPVSVIGMCVALLASVLLLLIGMIRPGFLRVVPQRAGPRPAVKRRDPRALSLAMICVLRT